MHRPGQQVDLRSGKVIVDFSKPLLEGGLGPARDRPHEAPPGGSGQGPAHQPGKPFDQTPKKVQTALLEGAQRVSGILKDSAQTYAESSEGYREWLTEYMSPAECPAVHGKRLRPASLAVRVKNFSIAEFTGMPISRALLTVRNWEFGEREMQIAGRVVDEIRRRLEFLSAVGLDYLSLERSAATLSGGEAQRIRLATQIGSKLRGVLYVLDEPSIGLHPRDNNRCSIRSRICATWATRCWWWSTMRRPSSAPIT
jgi:excinuclease ABC subunit A